MKLTKKQKLFLDAALNGDNIFFIYNRPLTAVISKRTAIRCAFTGSVARRIEDFNRR